MVIINRVDILLSTYNGEKYLSEQLDSIINQTHNNWRLIVRDDGSIDNTMKIINEYKKLYPDNFLVIPSFENLGSAKSFLSLIEYAKSPYVMFCDQDDVWLNNKIEVSLEKIRKNEINFNGPVLVHSDLKVVDENLKTINESFTKAMKLKPYKMQVNNLLIQNNVTGCTIIMNQSLYTLIKDFNFKSKEVIMHDWFIALFCSANGKMDFINQSLILYRQHSNNVVGAKKINIMYYINLLRQKLENNILMDINYNRIIQAQNVRDLLLGNNVENKVINEFINMNRKNSFFKVLTVIRFRFYRQSFLSTILYIFSMIFERRKV